MKPITLIIIIALLLPAVSALEVEKETINDVIIKELSDPAIFNLKIQNTGAQDDFKIYNLVGITLQPTSSLKIGHLEKKEVELKIFPNEKLLSQTGPYSFVYKIKGKNTEVQDEILTIRVIPLNQALAIKADNIHLNSTSTKIYITNQEKFKFNTLEVEIQSEFFSESETISLEPYERATIEVQIDKEKMKSKKAGYYELTAIVKTDSINEKISGQFQFTEKADISRRQESSSGIIKVTTLTKTNEGNLEITSRIEEKIDIISRLFTTFNLEPSNSERHGLFVYYTWTEQLGPSESLIVKIRTSWIIPIVIIIIVIVAIILIRYFLSTKLSIKKSTHLMRTKGGEFALKITLKIKSKKFIEKISIVDKLPQLPKLHAKFITKPEKIDKTNKRIFWNISSLNKNESRVISYIVYSKVGVVGKFSIPQATSIYETKNKVHESYSNKLFFFGEQRE